MSEPNILYRVQFPDPGLHIYHVTMTIDGLSIGKHRLRLPVWTPGSYQVADFAGDLFDLHAESNSEPLPAIQTAKNRFEFETSTVATVTVEYRVYAYREGVRSSHLDQSHAYWNGAQLFFLLDDFKALAHDVEIRVPPAWRVSTGLTLVDDHRHRYRAQTYDVLIDSPVEIGEHTILQFEVGDKPHTIALWGHGNEDPERLVSDVRRIVETARDFFGDLPYDHYTFIFHLSDHGTGGLEHLNSTTCGMERFSFRPEKEYRRVLSLIAHEFFHLWNVKRIHPSMLGPFDYDREVYTHLLWAMEGLTEYYAGILLKRSGLYSLSDYFERLQDRLETYAKRPGRNVQSLSQSSFETWIKFYRPGPDSPNRQISYYLKGELVGLLLDLEIRRRTDGNNSLDDVLRLLYERYGKSGIGFPESVYQETVEELTESSFQEFFQGYIESVDALPIDQMLEAVGIHVDRTWSSPGAQSSEASQSQPLAWLGVDLKAGEHGIIEVATVYADGPARQSLAPGDRLVALNDYAFADVDAVVKRVQLDHKPGDLVRIHFLRRSHLEAVSFPLGEAPCDKIRLSLATPLTAPQVHALNAWLGPNSAS